MEPTELEARAHRAYEWGRWRKGLASALWALPAIALSFVGCSPRLSCWVSPVVLALSAGLVWRGGPMGRGVVPGLLAGTVPVFVPVLIRWGAWPCSSQVCALTALGGGFLAGLSVSALAARLDASRSQLAAASAVAGITGLLGCAMFGVAGLVGLAGGLLLGTTPGYLLTARRA